MKIGVYVGSFNPVHQGHIHLVNFLLNNNYVDKVLILPTPNYWDKQNLVAVHHRVNMLRFYENDKIVIDAKHNNYQYTYQVLESLKKDYDDLYLIIGSDNLEKFRLWKNVDQILKYKIIVLNRGNNLNKYLNKDNFIIINNFDYINISSTEIRKNLKSKYLDKKVYNYIIKNNLYKED